eukprot:jgi/Chrpa1/2887/Chrysochromulina_OHIO_Genome00012387-RA
MPKERECMLDEASIKAASKQFDLSLCFKLSMPRMGIRRITNMDLVPSLTELDLSGNRLERIEGLHGLESLKKLVLSNNEIARIEGLEMLDALETLQLQGNRISNLDDVQCLTALSCLRQFQLQVRGGEERNPICEHPAYRTAVRRMLPRLQTLDGERIVLADAALPNEAGNALSQLSFAEPEPWLKNFDWGDAGPGGKAGGRAAAGGQEPQLGTLQGSAEFDALVIECKRLSARAQTLIDDHRAHDAVKESARTFMRK